jgi:hypothetical protein
VGEDSTAYEQRRVTVSQAAAALGISAEAVRMRVRRGTLRSEHVEGTVYVLLDADQTRHVGDTSTDRTDLLIAELQDRVSSLERALEEERGARTEERRRHDTLMAQLMQRIPALEPPESPETPPEPVPNKETPPQAERPAERPWWRRVFGS